MSKKEQVDIDIIWDESGHSVYQVIASGLSGCPADVCGGSGMFIDEYALDEFLEDHADEIEIVTDYRKEGV